MSALTGIIVFGILMSILSLIGAVTLVFREKTLERILKPLVAVAAGSMIGGAFFHMLPKSIEHSGDPDTVFLWVALGFVSFLLLEQVLNWHHCHKVPSKHTEPVTHLILIADGLHNLIGGVAVGATFIIDVRLGIVTWLVAAAHEIPQELGDFGVLLHGGWEKSHALLFNFFSSLTFLLGGLIAYWSAGTIPIHLLVPFAAGNFIYIGATDLVPEIKGHSHDDKRLVNTAFFLCGLFLLYIIHLYHGEH